MDNKDTDTKPVEGSEGVLPNNDESPSESIKVNVIQPDSGPSDVVSDADSKTDSEPKIQEESAIKTEVNPEPIVGDSTDTKADQAIAIPPKEETDVAEAPAQEEVVETYNKEVLEGTAPVDADTPKEAPVAAMSHPNISNSNVSAPPVSGDSSSVHKSSQDDVAKLKKSNKKLKILSSILILLFVAIASAGIVSYTQKSTAQQQLNEANQQNAALEQQLTEQQKSATQSQIDDLTAKNAELQKTVEEQKALIKKYEEAVEKLKDACANSCSDIDVPTDTTNPETTPPANQ